MNANAPCLSSQHTERKLGRLARWLRNVRTVVWFTGAGISTESGMPDYRGPDGAWTRRDQGLPPPRPTRPLAQIEPNAAHRAIVEFERLGKCAFLISQNVDNLHIRSGYPPEKLAELHGNKSRLRCLECQRTVAIDELVALPRRKKNRKHPDTSYECPGCGGLLRRSVVNFGDNMPAWELESAFHWAEQADLFIVVGSSCSVMPASLIPLKTVRHGGRLVVMNIGETGVDDVCHLRFGEDRVGQLLPALLQLCRRRLRRRLPASQRNDVG